MTGPELFIITEFDYISMQIVMGKNFKPILFANYVVVVKNNKFIVRTNASIKFSL